MTWFLDLRASRVGGIPASEVALRNGADQCLNFREFLELVSGRDVLFGSHGFNVDRDDGITKLSGWESLLNLEPKALFVGVLWPGDSRWIPVLDYPFEDHEAIVCAQLLAPFVDKYFGEAASLSFVSHSLGARMVLETLSRMQRKVTQVILMAGAINDDCLSQQYLGVVKKLKSLAVLASLSDSVLQLAFPLGNPIAGILTQGHPYWRGALGRYGPQSPRPDNLKSSWLIPESWDYGHGDYLGGCLPKSVPPVTLPALSIGRPESKPGWSAGFVSTQFNEMMRR